jgi:hypothetical protein
MHVADPPAPARPPNWVTTSGASLPAGFAPPQSCASYQFPIPGTSQTPVYDSNLDVNGCHLCAYSVATCGGITVPAGQTLIAGTTGINGAECAGDTMLWLQAGGDVSAEVLASSDNYGGTACSYIKWTALSDTTVFLREGCQSPTASNLYGCGGTVMYSLSGYVAPPPPQPPAVIPVSLCAPFTSAGVSDIGTAPNGAGILYNRCTLQLTQGSTVTISTGGGIPGAQCSGDTYLYLGSPTNDWSNGGVAYRVGGTTSFTKTLATNGGGGKCGSITYTPPSTGTYILLEGCYSSGQCSGTAAVQGGAVITSAGIYPSPPSPPLPPSPSPPVPGAPVTGTRAPTANVWTAWSKSDIAFTDANGALAPQSWLSTYNAASSGDAAVFPTISGAAGGSGAPLTTFLYRLTNGVNQASSISFGASASMPFLTNDLCPMTAQGFSLRYSYSLSQPSGLNSLGNGLAVSFVDASAAALSFPREFDQNGVLVPDASSITLQVDTYDNACGATPDTPCTGTWTQYDNSKVAGAGIGYRVVSTSPSAGSTVTSQTLASQLLYGGRYTSVFNDMNGAPNVQCVATSCSSATYVSGQVDYYSASRGRAPLTRAAHARPLRRREAVVVLDWLV